MKRIMQLILKIYEDFFIVLRKIIISIRDIAAREKKIENGVYILPQLKFNKNISESQEDDFF